ncbi:MULTISPECIES: hypothetical protein [Pacificibacter]|uniref:hypothetical protein n=1 Tax=Pacificibacter TaxID=1042323 RepID=UPI001C09C037|nr:MULTISPECIES: hypothetical protein [Pacificibacter]MBU2937018.1 hypothetical protein [Pacificibacter marinus]MDO6616519.1 hypothetical protein [Pacificibacter sp. 1_MG-2023]
MALVNSETAKRLLSALGTDSGRKAFLGDGSKYDAVPATKIMKLHHSVGDAVKRIGALEWDKTRTPAQQHSAGRKISDATVAEISKTRAELKSWVAKENAAAMQAVEDALAPDIGTAAQVVRSEIRAFVLSKQSDPAFGAELRGLVETDLRFATALFEAPAALSGMSQERLNTLRLNAAIAHAPEAAERVRLASEVAELDGKLASVAAEVPRSFYDGNIEKGMATHVDVNAPLATGE